MCKIQCSMCKIQNVKYNLCIGRRKKQVSKFQSLSNNWSQLRMVWCSRMWRKSSMWRRKQNWARNKQNAKYNLPSVQKKFAKSTLAMRQCPICSVYGDKSYLHQVLSTPNPIVFSTFQSGSENEDPIDFEPNCLLAFPACHFANQVW